MIRPLPGLTRRDLLPFASGILAPGFSATLSAAVSRHGGARRVRLSLPLFAFLREYAGPLALILPLALALALVRTPATVPARMAPPAPVAPASVAPMPDTLAATQAPQPVVPAPETTVPDTIAAAAGSPPSEASSAKAPLTYLVQAGDTVGGIAESFGISADTILSANDIDDPTALQIGAELTILPVSALVHTVAAGDTLAGIASEYGVSQESIESYNPLPDPEGLTVGDKLVVPGGRLKVARAATSSRGGARPSAPSGSFRWPTTGGISTYFSGAHRGIDIMSSMGVPIYAADGGTVVTAIKGAYDYGNYLVIDHGNGYRTLYAHLSAFSVEYGERVGKGENIGAVGSTGISTGPHLHFEVWENGVKVDPLGYLP